MSYCDVSLVKTISGVDNTDIRDQKIRDIRDDVATPKMNNEILTRVDKEKVQSIAEGKDNVTDGSNETFYLKETHDSFREVGDLDDNGTVDNGDIEAWAVVGDERIDVNVTELVDAKEGEFKAVKESDGQPLPNNANLYVRYRYAPVNFSEPNAAVSVACAQLTSAFCFSNIETSKLKSFSIGDVDIRRQSEGFAILKDQYMDTRSKIVAREVIEFGENVNEIEDVLTRSTSGGEKVGHGKKTFGRFSGG